MGGNLIRELLGQVGFYRRSFAFFLSLALGGALLYGLLSSGNLHAEQLQPADSLATPTTYDLDIYLTDNGYLYLNNSRLNAETFAGQSVYRLRYQVVNRPKEFIDQLSIAIHLPKPGNEDTISHRFVNNGGALLTESQLVDDQTVVYTAHQISPAAQLAIELEVPKSFVKQSLLFAMRERIANLPLAAWSGISIGLPALTALILLLLVFARNRRVPALRGELDQPPSHLKPAMLGIVLHGRLTNRELAATLIDLARRGHLVIRHVSMDDFRFSRKDGSSDQPEEFEQELMNQLFGPSGQQASSNELTLTLSQAVFSTRVSQAFIFAYKKITQLGYFYTNPLSIHRRYQIIGILLFLLGLGGFFTNLLLFGDLRYSLVFWLGMMIAALLISHFAKSLPVRTAEGDRELAKWLAFGRYLSNPDPVNYQAQSQEKYLAYLPYAIILGLEVEWTKRFYQLPFALPSWYVAAQVTTVDEFANKIFPLFGYLSHILALSSQPAAR